MRSLVDAVVIGGSAGAIDALDTLLPALPASLGAAVIVVIHLPAGRPSLLASIYTGRAGLPVGEAEDKASVAPGVVHFAPPGYHLLVEPDRSFALSIDEPVHFSRPSIDVLFESAAWAYGPRLLGVLLSGASADGADGLAAIARAGGLCWVQAPETAASPFMPTAALRRTPAARVLAPNEMAEALRERSALFQVREHPHGR